MSSTSVKRVYVKTAFERGLHFFLTFIEFGCYSHNTRVQPPRWSLLYDYYFVCRSESWNGIAQNVDAKPGTVYNFTSFVKITNSNGAQYGDFLYTLACKASDGRLKGFVFLHTSTHVNSLNPF